MSDIEKEIIMLPSIRDDINGNKYLVRLAERVISNPMRHYDFDFKNCSVLDQNAVAMLGGLARYITAKSSLSAKVISTLLIPRYGVMFHVDTMNDLVRSSLIRNNFLSYFSQDNFSGYPEGGFIGYREHTSYLDVNEIARHLHDEWLSAEKLKVSSELKKAVVSKIFEIFANAYGHGVQKFGVKGVGVFSCGQYSKKEGELRLTVLDFGRGIVENVRSHQKFALNEEDSMKWALERGNSTKTDSIDDIPRGLGFVLLNEFVTVNKGELSIYSNSFQSQVDDLGGYKTTLLKNNFLGTMVNIKINCDDRYYHFIDEETSEQYF